MYQRERQSDEKGNAGEINKYAKKSLYREQYRKRQLNCHGKDRYNLI